MLTSLLYVHLEVGLALDERSIRNRSPRPANTLALLENYHLLPWN